MRKTVSSIMLATIIIFASCHCRASGKIAGAGQVPIDEIPAPRVHFLTGRSEVVAEEREALIKNSSWMQTHPEAVFVLEGHCDERGGDLFNMELGDRRARAVKAELIRLGLDADRMIMVVSHGDRSPEDPAHTENAWKRNRRVEFVLR